MQKKLIWILGLILISILLSGCIQPEIKVKEIEKEEDIENIIPEVNPEELKTLETKTWIDANESGIKTAKKLVIVPFYEGKELNIGKIEVEIKNLDLSKNEVNLSYRGNVFENFSGSIKGKLNYIITVPYFWKYSENVESGLIFLPSEAIKELKEATSSAVKFEFLQRMPQWFKDHINFLGDDVLSLYAEPNAVDFEVKINGKIKKIKAAKCKDSMNNKYIISLDEEFPIILQLEYSNYFRKKTEIDSYIKLQENVGFKVTEIYK